MVSEADLVLADGRTLHYYETVDETADVAIFWQHGTPNIGEPPEPLLAAAAERGMRWVSYDRPAYGGSTRRRGRDVASAAADTAAVADALGIDRFAVMGHSGGHARPGLRRAAAGPSTRRGVRREPCAFRRRGRCLLVRGDGRVRSGPAARREARA